MQQAKNSSSMAFMRSYNLTTPPLNKPPHPSHYSSHNCYNSNMNNVSHISPLMHSMNSTSCYILSSYMYNMLFMWFLSPVMHPTFIGCVPYSYTTNNRTFMNKTIHFGSIYNTISNTLYFYSYIEIFMPFILIFITFDCYGNFDSCYLIVGCKEKSRCYY